MIQLYLPHILHSKKTSLTTRDDRETIDQRHPAKKSPNFLLQTRTPRFIQICVWISGRSNYSAFLQIECMRKAVIVNPITTKTLLL